MIRRPPRSTLFPSTPLSRSPPARALQRPHGDRRPPVLRRAADPRRGGAGGRSEEHTSELQSRLHLVCRLLLEKKKQNKRNNLSLKMSQLIGRPKSRHSRCTP